MKRFNWSFYHQSGSWVLALSLRLGQRSTLLTIGVKDSSNQDFSELLSVMSLRSWEAKIGTKRVGFRIFTMRVAA